MSGDGQSIMLLIRGRMTSRNYEEISEICKKKSLDWNEVNSENAQTAKNY